MLYEHRTDPSEDNNVSAESRLADTVKTLTTRMRQMIREIK